MNISIKIIVADDYPLFREGISIMLEKAEDIIIAGEANDGRELVEKVQELQPDVVMTDIEMPIMDGVEATRQIKKDHPQCGVIALTMFGEEHLIVDMLEAGASGYLLKSSKKEEVVEAIRSVHSGQTYFCNRTSLKLSKMIAKTKISGIIKPARFSDKEIEIIKLICEQYASKQIASHTNLTHRTVEKYRDNIMQKTGATNVVGIVIYAIRNGLYKP